MPVGNGKTLSSKYLHSRVCVFIVTWVFTVVIATTDGPCLSQKVPQARQLLLPLPTPPFHAPVLLFTLCSTVDRLRSKAGYNSSHLANEW